MTGAMFGVNEKLDRQMQSMTRRLAAVGATKAIEGESIYGVSRVALEGVTGRRVAPGYAMEGFVNVCGQSIGRRLLNQLWVGGNQANWGREAAALVHLAEGASGN